MEKHYKIQNIDLYDDFIKEAIDKSYQVKVQNNYDANGIFIWNNSYSDDGLSIVLNRLTKNDQLIISHRFTGDIKSMRYYIEIIFTNKKDRITIDVSDTHLDYFKEKYNFVLI